MQVSLMLKADQLEVLKRIARKVKDDSGRRLPVNAILRSVIRLFCELGVDPVGVHNEKELLALIQRKIKKVGG